MDANLRSIKIGEEEMSEQKWRLLERLKRVGVTILKHSLCPSAMGGLILLFLFVIQHEEIQINQLSLHSKMMLFMTVNRVLPINQF